MLDASSNAKINQLWNNELVSKIRPEAWWSYYSQGYKSPNGLSLYRYPKNCGKLVKDNTD